MSHLRDTTALFRIPEGKPELVAAQLQALSYKVPLMYGFVILSIVGLAFTHFKYAPIWMTVYIPAVLVAISFFRLIGYVRVRDQVFDEEEARKRLIMTARLSLVLSLFFAGWALGLTQYGTPYTQAHVIAFFVVTGFGNAACLMHIRAAVVAMLVGAIVPLVAFLAFSGNVVYLTMAVTIVGVTLAIMLALFDFNRDFEQLVESSVELSKERCAAEELSRINYELANVDSLTGLQNRRGFFKVLEHLLEDETRRGTIAIGVLDLDGFKPINDVYGHPAGDVVLKEVGKRLEVPGSDMIVARLGGDEFGLIFTHFSTDNDLIMRGETVCERMRVPFRMDGFSAQMSGSIGLAIACSDVRDSEELMKRADHALYHAKEHANGSAVLFNETLATRIRESMSVERHLRDANLQKEMSLAYQLVYDSSSNSVVGAEALARWNSPMLGAVPPDVFIPAAERSGVIGQVTEVLFRKLLAEFCDWPPHIFVSFNLSAHDICAPERIMRLISIADRKGVDPKRLTFEITETAVMHDFDRARESLSLLKHFGAKIALDDFGTGHSSLSYVHTLPLDRVKVDRSFVAEIEHSAVTRAVVQTVLDLCTHLDLDCIIEGVETEGQLQLMQKMGCITFQGYLFSRPLSGVETRRFIVASEDHEMRA